ncbi:MAG TPA: serine/threonine-protein kinase [Polyangiaceae bacterium]|nr:serine/threonine-protein kinase [Polyangiaceae bacterium]
MRQSLEVRDVFLGQVLESAFHPGISYRLEHKLGEGATAVAYLAKRQGPDGEWPAVIKIIQPHIVKDSGERALTIIKKEAVALGRLNERVPPTPFVVRLLDTGTLVFKPFGKAMDLPWIALEYVHGGVEGTTLQDRVAYSVRETGFAFDPQRAARVVMALAKGMDEIHAVGVVHRDAHPGNVLCCGAGETELFKMSDFGIARPMGMSATFGNVSVGTPGYIAPEQYDDRSNIGPLSDLFSLGAIIFYVLTGENMFEGRSAAAAAAMAKQNERRSLLDIPTLAFEMREREAACLALDLALSRATSPVGKDRPQNGRLFAESLLPWLISTEPNTSRPSRRWMNSMEALRSREMVVETNWTIRHPPGDDRLVTNVAWDSSGNALALTTRGPTFWDGTRWLPLPAEGLPPPDSIRFVERLGAASWLIGTEGAKLLEYSRDGARELVAGPDPTVAFSAGTTDLDDLAVMVGERRGEPPMLFTLVGKRWLRPLPVTGASMLTGVARIDDERFLVVGRGIDGEAFAAVHWPLHWAVQRLQTPKSRAFLACASRPERKLVVAVGTDGVVVEIEDNNVSARSVPTAPDMVAMAIDTLGRQWAAGRGRVYSKRIQGEFNCVWEHQAWQPPFVGIMAEVGSIVAVTVDGAVLECRSMVMDKTTPAF